MCTSQQKVSDPTVPREPSPCTSWGGGGLVGKGVPALRPTGTAGPAPPGPALV